MFKPWLILAGMCAIFCVPFCIELGDVFGTVIDGLVLASLSYGIAQALVFQKRGAGNV